ncbi:MAG: hypothetical protein R3E82_14540 [Pseudomonadales bacterium]
MTANSNQTLLDEIIDMNDDVQDVEDGLVPAAVLDRANEIEAEARVIGRLSGEASQEKAQGEHDREKIAELVDTDPRRATRQTAGAAMSSLLLIDDINSTLETLYFSGRQADELADIVVDRSVGLLTNAVGMFVSGPFAPVVAIGGFGVSALLQAIFGDTEQRIAQYTDLRDQQVHQLIQETRLLATRTRLEANAMTNFVNELSPQSRNAYYTELSLIEARDRANMADGRAPQIMIPPTTPEEATALAVRSEGRARLLQTNLQDELNGFLVPPTEEEVWDYATRMVVPTHTAQVLLEQRALADAFVRARAFITEMYADIWWTSRFFERQLEALAAVGDRPTMVEREDPDRPGETRLVTAFQALEEDQDQMIALHEEMTQIHASYASAGTCPGIQ